MKRSAALSKLYAAGVVVAISIGTGAMRELSASPAPDAPLIAHEWGTFTALQDDDGTALGAINADDEPVPDFVPRVAGFSTLQTRDERSPRLTASKGILMCHPGVTLRLETPVIYFYPPEKPLTAPVNVRVTFRGGWLTEFYPRAEVHAPGLPPFQSSYPPLTVATTGSLAWNDLKFAASGKLVATDDPVWTAPREVARAAVVTAAPPTGDRYAPSQPEKFLFYRGVGHRNAPLRVVRDGATDVLSLFANPELSDLPHGGPAPDLRVPAAWLVEIRPRDGWCAFRPVPGALNLGAPATQTLSSLPASFSAGEFGAGRLEELREEMQTALVTAGLFPDEAAAMLKTWELSYFKSPGRRLFYITPRAWTEQVLPLSIDGAEISRVMVGRIELITPAQRIHLACIAAGPCPDMEAFLEEYRRGMGPAFEAWQARVKAAGPDGPSQIPWKQPALRELQISVPAVYQDYLSLGRFRDALTLREQQLRPTPALTEFVNSNELRPR